MMDIYERHEIKSNYVPREDEYRNDRGILSCKDCNTPREHLVHRPHGDWRYVRVLCTCQREKQDREAEAKKARELRDAIARNRNIGLTEPLMREQTFENDKGYNPREMAIARNYVAQWEQMKKESKGLLLWGDVGTGKSYIASCIANALLDKGVSVLDTRLSILLDQLGALHFGDKNGFISSLNRYELLILDDLGIERDSEYVQEQCFNIIDSRYLSGLPIIITTNFLLQDMKTEVNLGKRRLFDRILERNVPVCVNNLNIRTLLSQETMATAREALLA